MSTKRLVILGGGESGVGAALLAGKQGYDVFVSMAESSWKEYKATNCKAKELNLKKENILKKRFLNADEVMKSPGIPEKNELVKKIREKGIPIISEIELAYRFKGNSKIIGITGSNGKTTTTALTYHICQTWRIGLCAGRQYRLFICKTGSGRSETIVCSRDQQFSAG